MAVQKYDIRMPDAIGDGFEERYWSPVNTPVLGSDGEIAYIIHRVQDVTKYVHLERKEIAEQHLVEELRDRSVQLATEIFTKSQEVAETNLRLKWANEELEAFNRTVSHDLRQPLNVIGSASQAVEMVCGDQLTDTCRKYIKIAYDKVLIMNRLIDALLKLSKTAHTALNRKQINLSDMAKAIVEELKIAEPNRKVKVDIAEGLMANADPDLMQSVLQNLIGNAWKYSGTRDEAIIEFGITEADGKPAYVIRDNGVGFDMTRSGDIFVPFKQLPGTEEFKGFGVGLSTAERIIRRHGGKIWAEGEPGKGACFFFTLPIDDNE